MFSKEEGQTRVVTVDEETAYLLTASQPLRDIATVILHTGMRPEEVFRIEVRNVDLRRKTVFNPWGKTKAAKRTVPLDEEALGILRRRAELAQRARSRYVFWSPQGPGRPANKERPIGSVRKAHDAAIDRAGVEDFRLYDLRHTFATRAAQAGVDVLTLAAVLGHTTVQMTSRYVHPTDAHKADAAKRLETYNAQLVAEMIERQRKVSTISTHSELITGKKRKANSLRSLVGARGFEPRTSCAQGRRPTHNNTPVTLLFSVSLLIQNNLVVIAACVWLCPNAPKCMQGGHKIWHTFRHSTKATLSA
jgi:integrase-like protein